MTPREKIEARIRTGVPFTYMALCGYTADNDAARMADRIIQKYRRAGWIEYRREKGSTTWSPTQAGRGEFQL